MKNIPNNKKYPEILFYNKIGRLYIANIHNVSKLI